ncbi:MAG TPA: hypothetical protein VK137_00870 [Planctomycetaceae bacterium]|nr:hypothetical protein [Planctomycetaceae bacterium]
MHGYLDEFDQAFLTVDFGQGPLDFLVDTGFCGSLIIGEELFDSAETIPAGPVKAELAADQVFVYDSYFMEFEWFGQRLEVQALVGPGKECLLGTILLRPHRLEIDYRQREMRLTPTPTSE